MPDGRHKAHLVGKGFKQVLGENYWDIFSPVVRYDTVRTIIALAALNGWKIEGLDVKTAFLYGDLNDEVYMEIPDHIKTKDNEGMVILLSRTLYGLKQAAQSWWMTLGKSMKDMGFQKIYSDAGVFIFRKSNKIVIVLVYVDDALFMGNDHQLVLEMKKKFMKRWECRDLGQATDFLSMEIMYPKEGCIRISQKAYTIKIIK